MVSEKDRKYSGHPQASECTCLDGHTHTLTCLYHTQKPHKHIPPPKKKTELEKLRSFTDLSVC